MRVHESPNTPFSVLYTRFPNGRYTSFIPLLHYCVYFPLHIQLQMLWCTTMPATSTTIALTVNQHFSRELGSWWTVFIGGIIQVCFYVALVNMIFYMYLNIIPCHKYWFLHMPGCSAGYNISTYPQFTFVNSEVVEQSNSWIKNIKGSVSYMNSSNFLNHCKLFYWYHNMLKKTKC